MMNIEAINKILTFRPREALDGLEALINDILEKCKWNIRGVRGTIKVDGG